MDDIRQGVTPERMARAEQLLREAHDALVSAGAFILKRYGSTNPARADAICAIREFLGTPAGQAAGDAGSEAVATPPAAAPVAPAADLPPLDAQSQQQVADFIRANKRYPVVSGSVIGSGGKGAIYELKDGTYFKLSAAELAHVTPRWDLPEPIGEEDQD